jgi:hypothetical protein
MNSVRAIMGATQVGGKGLRKGLRKGSRKGSRTYGGLLQLSSYNFDCNCSGDDAQNNNGNGKTGYGSTASMPLPSRNNSIKTGLIGPSLQPASARPTNGRPNPYAFSDNIPAKTSSLPVGKKNEQMKLNSLPNMKLNSSPGMNSNVSQLASTGSRRSNASSFTDSKNPYDILNRKDSKGKLLFEGGARRRKARKSRKANAEKYRKFLDGLDVKRLQKIAKTKGIKITKKKDGKTVYCKKATIVSKLFKFKYGK